MPVKPKIYSEVQVEALRKSYIEDKMSTTDIAEKSEELFGVKVSPAIIYKELIRHNIPVRNKSESVSMANLELDQDIHHITEELIEWIDGFLLGDGGIEIQNRENYMGSRFAIGSSSEQWTKYAISKFNGIYGQCEVKKWGKIDEKHPNYLWYSRTLSHSDIIHQAERWYFGSNKSKKIPSDVRITPISVMLWYLGDGSFHYEEEGNMSILRLSTCAFDRNDLEQIVIPKLKAHNIDCYVDEYKNDIHVRAESIKDFFNFIGWKSPIACYDHKFSVPEWLKLIRLSEIVKSDKEKWRAQYYYKRGKIECSKSPGGKMLLFTREQAEKLRNRLV